MLAKLLRHYENDYGIIGRLLNELRLRRDIARLDNQAGKLGSSPAQIKNNLDPNWGPNRARINY